MTGITDPTEAFFKGGQWGWDGTQWRKLPLLFGYYDRWSEDLGGTKSGGGTYSATGTAVPEGYVYVLQGLTLSNQTGARGRTHLKVSDGTTYWDMATVATPAQFEPTLLVGVFVLKQGDRVRVQQESCLDNDVIDSVSWGYKMKIAE